MLNFNYYNPANIYFGKNEETRVGELINKWSRTKKVLILFSGDYYETLGIAKTIHQELAKYEIQYFENGHVVPNPALSLINELSDFVKKQEIDFILAVGGGSVIDTAKATALGSLYEGDAWDFFTGKKEVTEALPVGAISTVASSGSEMSPATIVSNDEYKLGVESEIIIPKFSIVNPEFTLKLPKYYTGVGTADILSHLLERYFSKVTHTDITDFLLEGAMKSTIINGGKLINDLENYDLRAEMSLTAIIAHNNSLELGREPDWGSHRIEHELSGQYGIVHGEGMVIVTLAWMKYVSKFYPEQFVKYGIRVFGIDPIIYSEEEIIDLAIEKTKEFFVKLGMKTNLTDAGIDNEHFEAMAERATKNDTQTVGHLKPLNSSDIVKILELAR
ncbi:iron-containing alcohol dehydrogenase [Enterococcus hulanensis]|uniref:Iron-containing alcohol dehydrogenase n=1 Tax=Enterococcus hulanensis TaxID=2559929 RepID=A0ABU3EXJ6_9ENTE|nr:iron-containing alcohol dehydrogenase [Enterococcus hulanensis]MDT2598666.1 iron-containing alcohol dehydrogenase [Enterococcus hulanensis]MDT2607829.1 iron-containing alcohol dehydrogenase [Enterococcus hulanensis]MDT2615124.1 iron-containing alcohol dehydrogenase [Enterococcus hulanensis]MDT2626905.1 iron-containing alcohol dehydrogenase [Enterococcus hulanensis]MDT2654196.1 iron-containing alcohol dehydrogenase [Enterococcus hulanensis]